jgi:hypothetical protein
MITNARTARQSLIAVSASLAALGAASTAEAASVQLSGGSTRLTQTQSTQKVLKRGKIVLRAARPATRSGRRITLPVTSGSVNTTNVSGRANHSGSISFGRGKRKGSITGLTIRLGRQAVLTGRIRGQRMTFLYLNTRATRFGQAGFDLTLSNVSGRLSTKAAKAMNTSLRTKMLKRGLGFVVSVTGRPAAVPVATGAASVPLSPALLQTLASQGASVAPIPPASLTNNTLTLPVVGGQLPPFPGLPGGLLNLAGGLNITKGDVTFPLSSISLNLSNNTLNLGTLNLPLANLTGTLAPVIDAGTRTFDFSGIGAGISNQASAALSNIGITVAPETALTAEATIKAIAKALVDEA